MEIIHAILNSTPFSIAALFVIGYCIYWINNNRKTVAAIAVIIVLSYVGYLQLSKKELIGQTNELINQKKELTDRVKVDEFGFDKHSFGYSLNNPGNIRTTSKRWKGEIGSENGFKEFSSMKYGFRAMTQLFHSYVKNETNTVRKIIYKYAPPSENESESYAKNVAKQSNVNVDKKLSEKDFYNGNVLNIMYAMVKVEQGYPPNITDLSEGYNMFIKNMNDEK
jgi:hypothetical protein